MHDEWLMSVLREIEDFAITNNLTELMPLVEAGYLAAEKELKTSRPIRLEARRLQTQAIFERGVQAAISPQMVVAFSTARTQ